MTIVADLYEKKMREHYVLWSGCWKLNLDFFCSAAGGAERSVRIRSIFSFSHFVHLVVSDTICASCCAKTGYSPNHMLKSEQWPQQWWRSTMVNIAPNALSILVTIWQNSMKNSFHLFSISFFNLTLNMCRVNLIPLERTNADRERERESTHRPKHHK